MELWIHIIRRCRAIALLLIVLRGCNFLAGVFRISQNICTTKVYHIYFQFHCQMSKNSTLIVQQTAMQCMGSKKIEWLFCHAKSEEPSPTHSILVLTLQVQFLTNECLVINSIASVASILFNTWLDFVRHRSRKLPKIKSLPFTGLCFASTT